VIAGGSKGLFVMSVAGLISASLVWRPTCAYAKEDVGPMAKLRRTEAEIRAAVSRRVPDWSPEADMRRRQIERLLGGLLDYDAIASEALGAAFSKLAPERRRDFLATFAALTRRTFVTRLENQKLRTSYDGETIQGSEARVTATACAPGAAPETGSHIVYRLERKDNDWRITDVIVDGTSLVATYKRQFRKLVEREGMDGLMERMHDQLASADRPERLEK
jgi:phospholipid transport system substrate-binding protein